jgi:hypothetical protein
MKFARHPELEGKHALLSASSYSWIRYDDDKILDRLETHMAAQHGTRLHNLAAELIEVGQKLPDSGTTLAMHVNDAIGFNMRPEVQLMASYNAFGTADAISYRRERPDDKLDTLRIHDLKTGVGKCKMDQLKIYAAYFCIEYAVNPNEIFIELRIYQNDEVEIMNSIDYPDLGADVLTIMGRVLHFDKIINDRRLEILGV